MIWPYELDNDVYKHIKNLFSKIEETKLYSNIKAYSRDNWNAETRRRLYSLGYVSVRDKSGNDHYFNVENNNLTTEFYKLSKTGKTAVKCRKTIAMYSDSAIEEINNAISLEIQATEFLAREKQKQAQVNSITSIIIDGLSVKYPKVKAAFDAQHRGAKNFLARSFKNKKLIINAKLTIEDGAKLDKLFEVLNEII